MKIMRWLPHRHDERLLFGGDEFGCHYCDRCGQFHIWLTESYRENPIRMEFKGYGKAIIHKMDLSVA